jgi:hypothetical protein
MTMQADRSGRNRRIAAIGVIAGMLCALLGIAPLNAQSTSTSQSTSTTQSGGIRITLSGPFTGTAGQPVTFSGQIDTSGLPQGTAVTIQWDFGDGGTATGQTVTHTYAAPGTYTVTLTVSAPGQLSSIGSTVVIGGGSSGSTATQPPAASARVDLNAGCTNVVLTWPDGTPIETVLAALSTGGSLNAIWWLDAAARQFRGFSPRPGAPNDLVTVSRLQPVFICLTAPGTLSRPPG